jgi:phthiocerol/phenolphthiocerol synthesis type-I polyketide synthase C
VTQSTRPSPREPIAIIGIGCRFPGGIHDPESYWRALREGLDAITEIPADRFDAAALYREGSPAPGRIGTRWGGFLEQIDRFDAAFFGISPREADLLDPQQRLLLETSWEALEDAGQPADALLGSRAGVFVGLWLNDYEARLFADPAVDFYMTTGSGRYAASGRISYTLGLQGPSVTIDTACSSSLVAVHLACQSLWSGECPLALAGGANVILQPHITIAYSQSGMMAADGRCKFGDARANGYVRSEGAAMLVLKPLSRALADGDNVYAVIRGSAVNNDGRSGDYLATPAQAGQEQMLRLAYRDAGVSPGQVAYVEAHGTGTGAGDPVELGALGAVLAEGRTPGLHCAVGSVKTNLGHTEGAAGVAGLIKAALVLRHREVPPTLHLEQPNPAIPWERLPLFLPREPTPLAPDTAPAIAGVSSFGIAGTNAHVVLEEYGREEERGKRKEERENSRAVSSSGGAEGESSSIHNSQFIIHNSVAQRPLLLPLSARAPEALRALAERWAERFSAQDAPALEELAYTASRRRSHHEHRLAVVARDRAELGERLRGFAAGEPGPGVVSGQQRAGPPKVVFVFPGQGSQWVGMGRELLAEEPVFRQALEECDAAMRPFVGWSLLEQLALDEGAPGYLLERIDVVQPALVSLDIALARLWRSWGIEPAAVVGHSMGEVAAACVAGALSLPDAMRVICLRSRLMRRISGQGAMAVVELPREAAQAALAGHEERVSVAASNSPRSTILAGEPAALQAVLDSLERQEVFCRLVNVDVASHSPQVDPLRDDLLAALEGIAPLAPTVPFHSTVLNRPLEGAELDPAYWARNLRQPVLFSDAVQRLLGEGHEVFIEVSPHPVLLPAVQQTLQHAGSDALALGSLRRNETERATLLGSLGELYAVGCPVAWQRLYPAGRLVTLPAYPWQRERFWYEAPARRTARGNGGPAHPLLDDVVRSATGHRVWEGEISTALAPYLADHRVRGQPVLPAAAYLELGLAAAETAGAEAVLEDFHFEEAILPGTDDTSAPRVQLVVEPDSAGAATLQVFSRSGGATDGDWVRSARGRLSTSPGAAALRRLPGTADPAAEAAATTAPSPPRIASGAGSSRAPTAVQSAKADLGLLLQRIHSPAEGGIPGAEHYRAMAERGLEYGASFQAIEEFWREEEGVVGRIRLPEAVQEGAAEYRIHPVLLDGCLQLLLQTLHEADPPGAHLPVEVRRLRLHRRPEPAATLVARAIRHADAGGLLGDVFLFDEDGRPVLSVEGVRFRPLPAEQAERLADWRYAVEWQRQPLDAPGSASEAGGVWLLLADRGGVAAALAARLESAGDTCVVAYPGDGYRALDERRYELDPVRVEDFERLLSEATSGDRPLRGVVHLWSLDAVPPESATADELEAAQTAGTVSVLHLVQALVGPSPPARSGSLSPSPAYGFPPLKKGGQGGLGMSPPRLWLVTRGVQAVGEAQAGSLSAVAHAPVWGMAGVLMNEHPELRCSCVDLEVAEPAGEALAAELLAVDAEERVAFRGGERYVARLVRQPEPAAETPEAAQVGTRRIPAPYAVVTTGAGVLDNLRVRPQPRRRPGRGEVEIEVVAVGLNFMNVMSALGTYPGYPDGLGPLGIECAGVVAAVGEAVEEFAVGDEVVAFAFDCLATHALADVRLVAPKPARLTFEQAATVPIAFLTASYALEHLGRLAEGERVLIHSATGGVGLAAIQLAQRAGVEVVATAGSEEKREYLRSLGIRHVFDSRSLAFAHEILEATGGEGVDVVLNSLAGEAIAKGLSILRPYGRFLELGKRDIYEGSRFSLAAFRNQLAYSSIDLDHGARARPALLGGILRRIMARVEAGELTPLPERVFPVSDVADAFRHMARAQHIGKVVIAVEETATTTGPASPVRPDATYLITGGLGALGLTVARWMVEHGARSLVLLGRSEPSVEAREVVAELESMGARVTVEQADVGREAELAHVLERIDAELPPLRGVVHAAGLLADATVLQLGPERLLEALAPKLRGAWNLHRLTLEQPLDFFVLFSSVSALVGIPGQANYAAANAFLDALAHARRALGLTALSIGWGPWSEVGLAAARGDRGRRLASQGLRSLSPAQGIDALGELLRHPQPAHLAVARLDAPRWCDAHSAAAASQFLSRLREPAPAQVEAVRPVGGVREAALEAPAGREREAVLEAHLRTRAAGVLRLTPERVALNQPLKALGMDSLMTLELRNRLEADLGIPLSATLIWNYPTITLLARHLAGQLAPVSDGVDAGGPGREAGTPEEAAEGSGAEAADDARFVELGRSEIESLLENELAAIDDLLSGS